MSVSLCWKSRTMVFAVQTLVFLLVISSGIYVCAKKDTKSADSVSIKQAESVIEDVTSKQLEKVLNEKDYVAVFWYTRSCHTCDKVLEELENIDDDTDSFGVDFVKINDKRLAKHYGIKNFPALTYFREKEPIIYEGDLMDEDSVLNFLTSLEALDLPDRIEEVNSKILQKIIDDTEFVAVLFCPEQDTCGSKPTNKQNCRKCAKVLQELENIDDEADQLGIGFVKISDDSLAEEYNLGELPKLVYYRHQIPIVYEGELTKEEDVLEWLVQNKSTGDEDDVIEEVTAKTLETLISSVDYLVVLFYDYDEEESQIVLTELEKIDDDCDRHGIQFVKIDDPKKAKEFGIDNVPAIVYFEKKIPNLYDGNLENEEEILEWLVSQLEKDEIEDITDEMLDRLIKDGKTLAVLFYDNNDRKSLRVLNELENIDDECDNLGVTFVKIDNSDEAKEYGIDKLPALVYFEKGIPLQYKGNLEEEEKVLSWIEHQLQSDEIEDVTDEMLDILIERMPYVAALFYDKNQKKSQKVLVELENIDDECDQNDIAFVKIDDLKEAQEYGVLTFPQLIFFEKRIPHIYEGDLMKEEELLSWLIHQKRHNEIPEVTNKIVDKLIDTVPYLAVLFYDKDDKQDIRILNELENIDDELEKENIVIVRMDNDAEAKEYGIDHLPTLVYFENKIPALYEGDLINEDEVLNWLIEQKSTATIEEVTDEILKGLVEEHEYVLVYFSGRCEDGQKCDQILNGFENIDDELDESGIVFVTTEDQSVAKEFGIKSFPALVFFRNKEPLHYTGDLEDEDEVLSWLNEDSTLEIPGKIEEVNTKMLDKILNETEHVVVFFYKEGDKKSQKILAELENIDDECEEKGISFVKTSDDSVDKEYDLPELPAVVYYRNKFRKIYNGDLMHEEAILAWVLELYVSTPDVIESVDRKTLQVLISEVDHLAVFFYNDKCDTCELILNDLETIDDDTDKHGIQFVKSKDSKLASELGIFSFPALVYYETGVPIMYDDKKSSKKDLSRSQNKYAQKQLQPSSGDSCFYIGLSGKEHTSVPSFEPYQCCRSGEKKYSSTNNNDNGKHVKKEKTAVSTNDKSKKSDSKTSGDKEKVLKGKKDGNMLDESEVLEWMMKQKTDESVEDIDRDTLFEYIETKEFLAVLWYVDEDPSMAKIIRHIELIDDEALEYGIKVVKCKDKLMAKKFGFRQPPGITYFRKVKPISYDGDIEDDEELLDWLTDPSNMEMTDHIERVNRKMFEKIRHSSDYVAVFFYSDDCKQCSRVLTELEHIDDDADNVGIDFVKINDKKFAKEIGVFALPAVVFFKLGSKEPVIYAGDLYDEEEILNWLMTQKDPSGDVIEELEGEQLLHAIHHSESLAVFFWNSTKCDECLSNSDNKKRRKLRMNHEITTDPDQDENSKPSDDKMDECAQCSRILEELENIDDDCDRHGITFVKTQDHSLAENFGVSDLPSLVYFENQIPNVFPGDLQEEEEVLQWLITQRTEDRIELITRAMLEAMVEDTQYLAVYFYKDTCHICEEILEGLESIDDECDVFGIHLVKILDPQLAKRYSIKTFPALIYFRNGNPLLFEGDLQNEESVLEWLIDDDNRELADEIEEVNSRMLERLLDESLFLAVLFYDKDCEDCDDILEELEIIDGEADLFGIDMVKISDPEAAAKYNIINTPSLVYFRKRVPLVYDGDLFDEDKILTWLTSQDVFEIKNEIEEVNRKMLSKLLDENEFLAVYFYEKNSPVSMKVLDRLERIDGETDEMDIIFVKMGDPRYARKWGVTKLPAIVYFRNRFPSIYRGDCENEAEVLEWLRKNRFRQPELNVFMYALMALTLAFVSYTAFLLYGFPHVPKSS